MHAACITLMISIYKHLGTDILTLLLLEIFSFLIKNRDFSKFFFDLFEIIFELVIHYAIHYVLYINIIRPEWDVAQTLVRRFPKKYSFWRQLCASIT